MAPGEMLRFKNFAMGLPKDVLFKEWASHHSHDAVEVKTLLSCTLLILPFNYYLSFCYASDILIFPLRHRVSLFPGEDMGPLQ